MNADPASRAPRDELTAADLARWCRRAQSVTTANLAHLNTINVIFDPDWDTGTNLAELWSSLGEVNSRIGRQAPQLLTPRVVFAAWGEDDDWDIVGRSTRILRRLFRAMASAARDRPVLDPAAVADLLAAAATIPDWADILPETRTQPGGPQPGTILDVVAAAADAAHRSHRAGLHAQVIAIATAAQQATDATPGHHSVLRRTGVVDAGALGLTVALQQLPNVLQSTGR